MYRKYYIEDVVTITKAPCRSHSASTKNYSAVEAQPPKDHERKGQGGVSASVRDSRGRTVSHRDDSKQNGNSKRSRDVVPQTRGLGGTTQARNVIPHIRLSLGTTIVPGTTQA